MTKHVAKVSITNKIFAHLNVVRDGQYEKEGCHGLGKFSGFIHVLRGVLIVDQTLGKLF